MNSAQEMQVAQQAAIDDAVAAGTAERCLDHGFVRMVDTMGDDEAIAEAARVSYGVGTKSTSDTRSLIRYLMSHRHTTPFEMCEIKLHVKIPVFVARQWIRHRTANVNEYSGRYSIMPGEFYVPEIRDIAPQSQTNRQGRAGELPRGVRHAMQETLRQGAEGAFQVYEELHTGWPWIGPDAAPWGVDAEAKRQHHNEPNGMARELARINLPLSTYTEFYWKNDLHNLLHFLSLRADSHAQMEIRVFADAILRMVAKWVPLAYEAHQDYRMQAVTLSRMEIEALREWFEYQGPEAGDWPSPKGVSERERLEFFDKLGLVK